MPRLLLPLVFSFTAFLTLLTACGDIDNQKDALGESTPLSCSVENPLLSIRCGETKTMSVSFQGGSPPYMYSVEMDYDQRNRDGHGLRWASDARFTPEIFEITGEVGKPRKLTRKYTWSQGSCDMAHQELRTMLIAAHVVSESFEITDAAGNSAKCSVSYEIHPSIQSIEGL